MYGGTILKHDAVKEEGPPAFLESFLIGFFIFGLILCPLILCLVHVGELWRDLHWLIEHALLLGFGVGLLLTFLLAIIFARFATK